MSKPPLPDGWMGKKGRKWLAKQARRHTRIIEVGAWKGRSTLVLARNTRGTVWAVDHWLGTPNDPEQHAALYANEVDGDGGQSVWEQFQENLEQHIRNGKVFAVRKFSQDAAHYLNINNGAHSFDFVFIDADHSYEGASGDIDAYLPLLKAGGLMAGHDFHWPGVERAVLERFPAERVRLGPKSIWSVRV